MTLDPPTRALVRLAAAVAHGRDDVLAERAREAVQAQAPAIWVDELLLLSMLMAGWPRALGAAAVWRRESGVRASATDVHHLYAFTLMGCKITVYLYSCGRNVKHSAATG